MLSESEQKPFVRAATLLIVTAIPLLGGSEYLIYSCVQINSSALKKKRIKCKYFLIAFSAIVQM